MELNNPSIKELQAILAAKDQEVQKLTVKFEELEKEKEDIIDNFQESTEVLMERIKELEAVSLGARPQTANILKRIEDTQPGIRIRNVKYHNHYSSSVEAVEKNKTNNKELEEKLPEGLAKCTNCGELIDEIKMATHTVTCFRNSTKCKVCGEKVQKSQKSEHLTLWRNPQKAIEAIEKDNEEELTLMLGHGTSSNLSVGSSSLLHFCAKHNARECLMLLISKGAVIDTVDERGATPLIVALESKNDSVATSLISLGAQIDFK